MSARRPLIVVANRLPVSQDDGRWKASAGGLVTALRPVMDDVGGAWIGWDDDADAVPRRVDGLGCDLHAVELTPEVVRGYYHGFSNRTLWPLFHDLLAPPVIDRDLWDSYHAANEAFAEVTAQVASTTDPAPTIWIQDYHLLLLPGMLRDRLPDARIGFFLHIPFPPPELIARLPWRDQLLSGMLAADSVGFHTALFRDNFLRSVAWVKPEVAIDDEVLTLPDGRQIRAVAHPISIDAAEFAQLARSDETEAELTGLRAQFEGRQVFLGVDRLDYTKGIRHRLQAIEQLLDRRPDLRGRFTFVQIAVPSRDDVKEYRQLRTQVETEVGRINGRFTDPGEDVPVHYLYRGVPREALAAYYRLADVMCVTPLKDGMNLVAKEFVTVQAATDGDGVLLLSELCGAAVEFGNDPVRCNPFDVEGTSLLMESALHLDPADRQARIQRLGAVVADHDVYGWVTSQLDAIDEGPDRP
jgi:trehalose 6-phosphate synthase